MALIPLPPPPPRHPWRRLGIVLGVLVGLGVLLMVFGEPVAEFRDQQQHPVPGRLVKVDEQPVHLYVRGAHGTLPTVVIDGDLGLPAHAWAQLIDELSKKTLVIAWDRPGYGWSALGTGAHDGLTLMTQLHRALLTRESLGPLYQGQEANPPYLLVGQGLGAAHMRIFANTFPGDVVGMVLLDPLYPGPRADQLKGREAGLNAESWKRRLFLRRLIPGPLPAWLPDVPSEERAAVEAMLVKTDFPKAEADEVAALDQTLKQADQLRTFGDKPLRVLRSSPADDADLARRLHLDNDLASLSTRGDLQVLPPADGAGPMAQLEPLTHAIQLALGISE